MDFPCQNNSRLVDVYKSAIDSWIRQNLASSPIAMNYLLPANRT